MSSLPKKSHWSPPVFYVPALLVLAFTLYYTQHFYVDDAYISLTYARNLLAGHGLTWNPGERVEGYSNFLYIMLTAGLGWLGMDLLAASRLISSLAFAGIVLVLYRYMKSIRPRAGSYAQKICRAMCVALALSSVPMIAWSFGGLESNLFAFFILCGVCQTLYLLQGRGTHARCAAIGLCFILATLTRPDGAVMFALTGGFLAFLWLLPSTRRHVSFTQLCYIAGSFALIYLPYNLWHYTYFGELLPNTYYAKTYGIDPALLFERGLSYLLIYMLMPPLLLPLTALVLLWVALRRGLTLKIGYLCLLAAGFMAYMLYVGGDHMSYMRFMLPLIPLLLLLLFHTATRLIEQHREKLFRDLSTGIFILILAQLITVHPALNGLSRGALSGLAVAGYIKQHWPAGSTIALNPAGALPYVNPEYRYVDMLGLMDKTIARRITGPLRYNVNLLPNGHLKGDGAYVLSLQPDYVIFGDGWGDSGPRFLTDMELADLPEFYSHYKRIETYILIPPELLSQVKIQEEVVASARRAGNVSAQVMGPVLNSEGQLRFIYYQRRK